MQIPQNRKPPHRSAKSTADGLPANLGILHSGAAAFSEDSRSTTDRTIHNNMNKITLNHIVRGSALLLLTSILTACLSPAQRMQTRQSTRVQERTEHRMENRGW